MVGYLFKERLMQKDVELSKNDAICNSCAIVACCAHEDCATVCQGSLPIEQQSLVFRLRFRAAIRKSIRTRKSFQENKPDRIAELLEEAANELAMLKEALQWKAPRKVLPQTSFVSEDIWESEVVQVKTAFGSIKQARVRVFSESESVTKITWISDCSEAWDLTSNVVAWRYLTE